MALPNKVNLYVPEVDKTYQAVNFHEKLPAIKFRLSDDEWDRLYCDVSLNRLSFVFSYPNGSGEWPATLLKWDTQKREIYCDFIMLSVSIGTAKAKVAKANQAAQPMATTKGTFLVIPAKKHSYECNMVSSLPTEITLHVEPTIFKQMDRDLYFTAEDWVLREGSHEWDLKYKKHSSANGQFTFKFDRYAFRTPGGTIIPSGDPGPPLVGTDYTKEYEYKFSDEPKEKKADWGKSGDWGKREEWWCM